MFQAKIETYDTDSHLFHMLSIAKNISKERYMTQKRMIFYLKFLTGCNRQKFNKTKVSAARTSFHYTNGFTNFFVLLRQGDVNMNILVKEFEIHSLLLKYPETTCQLIICPSGWHPSFGRKLPHESIWNDSFGNTCRRCPKNYIKPLSGNTNCFKCPENYISNEVHTECLDSLTNSYSLENIDEAKLSWAISTISFLFSSSILFIIVKYKNTPLAKSLDVKNSIVHIAIICTTYLVFPIIFSSRFVLKFCWLQPAVISILYSLNTGCIFTRSHKLLIIFSRKQSFQRVSSKTKMLSWLEQMFVILIFVFVGLGTFFTSNQLIATRLTNEINFDIYERRYMCNTNFHINCLVAVFIICHIFCAIPAYRGRNLPSIFREAMMIVYISFICVVSFCAMFPINIFQKHFQHKACVHWIVFHVNTNVVLLILYGWKCFIMVFLPARNTKKHVSVGMNS